MNTNASSEAEVIAPDRRALRPRKKNPKLHVLKIVAKSMPK